MDCIKFRYIFKNEPPKSSPGKEVEKQSLRQLNGKNYSIYRVTENCSVAERIVTFMILFFPVLLSFGTLLLKPYLRASAKSIFTGKVITEVAVPDNVDQKLKIARPSNNTTHLDNELSLENQNSNFDILNQFFQKLEIQDLSKLTAVSKKTKKNIDTYFDKNLEKKLEKLIILNENYISSITTGPMESIDIIINRSFIRNELASLTKDILKEENLFDILKTLPDKQQKQFVTHLSIFQYPKEYDESKPDFILANAMVANKNIIKFVIEFRTNFEISQIIEFFCQGSKKNVTFIQQLFHELSINQTALNKLLQNQSLTNTILTLLMNIMPLYEQNRVSYGHQVIYPGFAKELIEKYRNLYPNSAELAQTLADPKFQQFMAELG